MTRAINIAILLIALAITILLHKDPPDVCPDYQLHGRTYDKCLTQYWRP